MDKNLSHIYNDIVTEELISLTLMTIEILFQDHQV